MTSWRSKRERERERGSGAGRHLCGRRGYVPQHLALVSARTAAGRCDSRERAITAGTSRRGGPPPPPPPPPPPAGKWMCRSPSGGDPLGHGDLMGILVKFWSHIGQVLVKFWSHPFLVSLFLPAAPENIGQVLVKIWSHNTGQVLVTYWSSSGHKLVKYWSFSMTHILVYTETRWITVTGRVGGRGAGGMRIRTRATRTHTHTHTHTTHAHAHACTHSRTCARPRVYKHGHTLTGYSLSLSL